MSSQPLIVPTDGFRPARKVFRWLFAGCLAVAVVAAPAQPARSAPAGCLEPTAASVAEFFDTTVPARLAQDHVPGLVVSVVSGGRTTFAEGYGKADEQRDVAFDPQRSMVRIASITKLFTWTAVMQLVEAGKLDLGADVNTYLRTFKVPATYPQPVTLQTLMDHTAGFEHRFIGTAAKTAADVPALGEFLAANMPDRIRPPGEVSAYSNYGAALAGYIVAEVSGEPYDQYVQRHILDPLAMTHSTATEPVPARLASGLARSYDSETGLPVPFTFDPMTPDGAISATANDIANFMLAHLRDGRFDGSSILSPTSARRMHETSFTADPRLGGYAHGFQERRMNGHRVLMHDGGWEAFVSGLILVPGCDLGLFLSANGSAGGDTLTYLVARFFDMFAAATFAPATSALDAAGPGAGSSRLATTMPRPGFYVPTRHNESTVEKLLTLLGSARLTVGPDGVVHFGGKEWQPQGDNLYSLPDSSDHLVAMTGTDGTHYVAADGPAYQWVSQDRSPPFNLAVLLIFAVPTLSAIVLAPVALWRRLRRRPEVRSTRWRIARRLAGGACLLGLVFLLAVVAFVIWGDFLYGVPLSFTLSLVAPILMLPASAAALAYTVIGWRASGSNMIARVHQIAQLVGLAALSWFLWQWNLIAWQLS